MSGQVSRYFIKGLKRDMCIYCGRQSEEMSSNQICLSCQQGLHPNSNYRHTEQYERPALSVDLLEDAEI